MQIIHTKKQLNEVLADLRSKKLKAGFVPTMGALHEGHMSLIKRSLYENDITICSVFVNPTQFNDPKDFDKYPRSLNSDTDMLSETGCDILFAPLTNEIYPVPETVVYNLGDITSRLEGAYRPGHFNGVASVVKKLFEAIMPDRAYFGLKDYQQFLVIKALIRRYEMNIELIGCEIVREASGLAMSSRNVLLKPYDRKLASELSKSLLKVKSAFGTRAVNELEEIGLTYLGDFPDIRVEYFAVVDTEYLLPIESPIYNGPIRALVAAHIGEVRLIDNMQIA
jgi:pantoate--beta-alanine ligase